MTAYEKTAILQFYKDNFNIIINQPFRVYFNYPDSNSDYIHNYFYMIDDNFEIKKIKKTIFKQKIAAKMLQASSWGDCDEAKDLSWSYILSRRVSIKNIDLYQETEEEEFLTLLKFLHNNDFDYLGLDVEGKKLIASNMMPVRTITKNGSIILQWQDDKQMTLPYKEDYLSFFGYPDKSSPIILKVKPYLMQAIDYHIFKNE